ncbi:MAG: type IV toxin-antitoxin system AbiEi family antitoxin domain-containing protein [Candidatus Obscuribacterales bacterium]|nr:type IV toxin-antitoxin system AbiEi family antitoxin domain-containing protein [Candidatus Obscuribacterales bacterium]
MPIPTITKIREFLANHSTENLFTTRDLLNLGKRSAVDNATHQLVKNKEIRRVARGVFCSSLRRKRITVLEVAETKAESFGRKLIAHAENLAIKLDLISAANTEASLFATNGNSSSFHFSGIMIQFKRISSRKFSLGESKSGQLIRAITHLGKAILDSAAINLLLQKTSGTQLDEILKFSSFMPAWLSDFFKDYLHYRVSPTQEARVVNESSSKYVYSNRPERLSLRRCFIVLPPTRRLHEHLRTLLRMQTSRRQKTAVAFSANYDLAPKEVELLSYSSNQEKNYSIQTCTEME